MGHSKCFFLRSSVDRVQSNESRDEGHRDSLEVDMQFIERDVPAQ
jgi:hypothetical protein